jgi:signal transduction histidine kinase
MRIAATSESRTLWVIAAAIAVAMTVAQTSGYFIWNDNPQTGFALWLISGHFSFQLFRVRLMLFILSKLIRSTEMRSDAGGHLVWRVLPRWLTVIALCTVVGSAIEAIGASFINPKFNWGIDLVRYFVVVNAMFASVLGVGWMYMRSSLDAALKLNAAELKQLATEQAADAARMQLLQAQVEPHFLFNALANARRLMRTDATAAKAMLTDLLQYLRVALPAMRQAQTTLGSETELVRAFLAIHQVRMGQRLTFDVDVPTNFHAVNLPSLALLTLVENAIKHGLSPLVSGGHISVKAHGVQSQLLLSVSDNGQGMGKSSGTGTGLANLRARLHAMHGVNARLGLALNDPKGIVASITLPLTQGLAA